MPSQVQMLSHLLLLATLLIISFTVLAEPTDQFSLSAGLEYEYTDNIYLSPSNAKSENILHGILNLNYKKASANTNALITINADRRNYQNKTLANQTVLSSDILLNTVLSKRRLFWDLENKYDKVQIQQNLPDLPDNQENANYLTTGPRLIIFQNDKSTLNAGLRYENFYTEKTNTDYSGYTVNASYLRNVTRTTALGFNVIHNDRKFDDKSLNADYGRTDITMRLSKRMKLSELEVDVGKTQLSPANGKVTHEGIFRANYIYQNGEKSKLDFKLSRELSDFANAFSARTAGVPTFTNVTSNVYLLEQGQINYVRNLGLSTLTVGYLYTSNDYENDLLDVITQQSSISVSTRFSASLRMFMGWTYQNTKFPDADRKDITRYYRLGFSELLTDAFELRMSLLYTTRDSTGVNTNYDEKRVILGGRYYFR